MSGEPARRLLLTSASLAKCPAAHLDFARLLKSAAAELGHSEAKLVYVADAIVICLRIDYGDRASALVEQVLKKRQSLFESLGATSVATLEAARAGEAEVAAAFRGASGVFFDEGHMWYQSYCARKNGVIAAAIRLAGSGGFCAGSSAGAILAGASLRTMDLVLAPSWADEEVDDEDWDPRPETNPNAHPHAFLGLGLVSDGRSVVPHCDSRPDRAKGVEAWNQDRGDTQEGLIGLRDYEYWLQDVETGRAQGEILNIYRRE